MVTQTENATVSQLVALGPKATVDGRSQPELLIKAARLVGEGRLKESEALALSRINERTISDEQASYLWLLCYIYSIQPIPRSLKRLIRRITDCVSAEDPRLHHLSLQQARNRGGLSAGPFSSGAEAITNGTFPHLDLEIGNLLLCEGRIEDSEEALERSNAHNSCEGVLLRARQFRARKQPEHAETLLLKNWDFHQYRLDYSMELVELLFELRRGDLCLPVLKQAVANHGCYASPLLERFAQGRMLQRQAGVALRLKLQERLPGIAGAFVSQPTILGAIYDGLGRSDWLSYLCAEMQEPSTESLDLHSNRLMHLSSRASSLYPRSCQSLVGLISPSVVQQAGSFHAQLRASSSQRLRVGWICADIANHPVARFLLSWLNANHDRWKHEHIVVSTAAPDCKYQRLFSELDGIQFADQSAAGSLKERIQRLRRLELDIAVDLNGWSGNHLAAAFIARVAPIQLNYLAYHASTGIPAVDGWIVDQHIVPRDRDCEWHTEHLVRLSRPFLAWQPHPALPEAQARITAVAFNRDSSIRFGCFNHLRKISDETLQCWARIMNALPTAKLVLKAYSAEDTATASLLERRLHVNKIRLDQVIWLPYTATPDEHLQQYAQMDVALDCFPNTGCTTTCEALWMGVPVITLQGQHYVSRMATAVLQGAGLPEWICNTTTAYESLAIEQAAPQRLAWLRRNRNHWRSQLERSPLGDANDLMRSLESTFSTLAESRLKKQTLQLTAHSSGMIKS